MINNGDITIVLHFGRFVKGAGTFFFRESLRRGDGRLSIIRVTNK